MSDSARHVKGTGPHTAGVDLDALIDGAVDMLCNRLTHAAKRHTTLRAAYAATTHDPRKTWAEKQKMAERAVQAAQAYEQAEQEHRRILKDVLRSAGVSLVSEVTDG